jgi:hypothetical protein
MIRLLAACVIASAMNGCAVDRVYPGNLLISELQGPVTVAAETVERLQCVDGLMLSCESEFGRLSDRVCRCLR